MSYNPDIHHRHSIRLKGFDYSTQTKYYLTFCTQDRADIFGDVIVGADLVSAQMHLSDAGKMIEAVLNDISNLLQDVEIDCCTIMPNHVHCILTIVGSMSSGRADTRSAPTETKMTVGKFVQAFKAKTTVEYVKGVRNGSFPSFRKRVWQRNYYEHIIRDEADYNTKCNYIEQNPVKWSEDEYNTIQPS